MSELVGIATDLSNKNHHKAIWIIELLAETRPELLSPFTELICHVASKYKHESAIRGISRTLLFLSLSDKISLPKDQQEKIIETSLDRLIGNDKIAPKAYAMYTLAHYAKTRDWIKDELRHIINKDFPHQSAGYKVAAREVLRKINA